MTTVDDLRGHPKVKDAERRLKKVGFTDAWWDGLLERVAALPVLFEHLLRETGQEATVRRKKLACEMRTLASAIDADQEASRYFPAYRGSGVDLEPMLIFSGFGYENLLTLSQWLTECAESLEARRSSARRPDTRVGYNFKPFVIRGVAHWIDYYLAIGIDLGIVGSNRSRNIETALLASAVLDENIIANEVTQLRKAERRKYHKE